MKRVYGVISGELRLTRDHVGQLVFMARGPAKHVEPACCPDPQDCQKRIRHEAISTHPNNPGLHGPLLPSVWDELALKSLAFAHENDSGWFSDHKQVEREHVVVDVGNGLAGQLNNDVA